MTTVIRRASKDREKIRLQGIGLLTETWPLEASANTTIMVGGTIYLVGMPVVGGEQITNLHIVVATAAVTTTLAKVGLYTTAGSRLAVTADLGNAWESTGLKTHALATPYTPPTDAFIYGAIVAAAGTLPVLIRGASSVVQAGVIGSNPRRYQTGGTGQTDLPTSITPAAGTPLAYWMGAS